jgi:hypothetical protein
MHSRNTNPAQQPQAPPPLTQAAAAPCPLLAACRLPLAGPLRPPAPSPSAIFKGYKDEADKALAARRSNAQRSARDTRKMHSRNTNPAQQPQAAPPLTQLRLRLPLACRLPLAACRPAETSQRPPAPSPSAIFFYVLCPLLPQLAAPQAPSPSSRAPTNNQQQQPSPNPNNPNPNARAGRAQAWRMAQLAGGGTGTASHCALF